MVTPATGQALLESSGALVCTLVYTCGMLLAFGLAVILPIVRNYDDVRSFATEKRADRERARARARARVRSGGWGGEAGEVRRRKRESRPRVTSPFLPRSCDARAPRR